MLNIEHRDNLHVNYTTHFAAVQTTFRISQHLKIYFLGLPGVLGFLKKIVLECPWISGMSWKLSIVVIVLENQESLILSARNIANFDAAKAAFNRVLNTIVP